MEHEGILHDTDVCGDDTVLMTAENDPSFWRITVDSLAGASPSTDILILC